MTSFLTSNQLNSFLSNGSRSIIHFNARSLRKHFDDFHNLLSSFTNSFSLIGITETWLSDNDRNLFCFPSYRSEYCHRHTRNHGGAAIYVSANLNYKRRHDLDLKVNKCESVWIELDHHFLDQDNKNFLFGCIYRSPSSPIPEFCAALDRTLNTLAHENKNVIIMGDININMLDKISPTCVDYSSTFNSFGFESLIKIPTRHVIGGGSTLIDHALSNLLTPPEAGVLNIDITDHYPVFLRFNSIPRRSSVSFTRYVLDKEKFVDSVANTNWSEIRLIDDPQEAFSQFLSIILSYLQSYTKKKKCKKILAFEHNPWLTDKLLTAMRKQENLYRKTKKKAF